MSPCLLIAYLSIIVLVEAVQALHVALCTIKWYALFISPEWDNLYLYESNMATICLSFLAAIGKYDLGAKSLRAIDQLEHAVLQEPRQVMTGQFGDFLTWMTYC